MNIIDRKTLLEQLIGTMHALKHRVFIGLQAPAGLTSAQIMAVGAIARQPGLGIKELAAVLDISSSAATQLVDALVDKGFLSRQADTTDRRAINILLSETSYQKIEEMKCFHRDRLAKLFEALTDDELEMYAKLTHKIMAAWPGKDIPDDCHH